ncbi:HIT family protein [Riemerella columbina]|uniref:HIT family protein n=1 Tax=Riemerella columbina TaxID=103810 RepID=UPI00266ED38F|nr:HIT family protein [Riemerella columbina]WKS94910.1 HIT family protein [Riemerella columbina]
MASIFSKIISGEIPAYKVAEDEQHLAFLDIMPLAEGHTLVIPKQEVDLIFDLDSEAFKNLWVFAQQVAKQLGATYPEKRVGVAVVGLEVPHAHIHLVPLTAVEDLNFKKERLQLSPEQYQEIQHKIKSQQN